MFTLRTLLYGSAQGHQIGKHITVEESQWKLMAEAVARVIWPTAEES
jgi:hypothetical protein